MFYDIFFILIALFGTLIVMHNHLIKSNLKKKSKPRIRFADEVGLPICKIKYY